MQKIIVYTTKTCPKCEQVKKELTKRGISFDTADMSTPEALTELKFNGVFTMTAPVLQINDTFLTHKEIFKGPDVNMNAIVPLLNI
jgi:glutaredoxin